ncbi:MAG: type 4a pilus biogenesis protein PilO [Nitrospirota bacterium]|nr:MAG: type 4a pilus biogenesis protein PilO [Nitrospirota bacterium]
MAKKLNLNLQNLPPAARIGIALIPTIIIIVVFFFFFYKPNSEKIKKLDTEILAQGKEIDKLEAKVAKIDIIKARYKELEFSLKVLAQQLPEENEVSGLLKQISDRALQSGLSINLWKPGKRSRHKSGIVFSIPVSVSMNGTYHNLGEFFSRITSLDRIVNIMDIKLGGGQSPGQLKITFRVLTYSAIPLDQLQKKGQGQKRR